MTEKESGKEVLTAVSNRRFELQGFESGRCLRLFLAWRPFRFGSLAKGPGFGNLMELWFRHRFGAMISRMTIRHEDRWIRLVRRGRRLRKKLRRQ